MADLSFGSVCSGIEAASVAFEPLGWRAAWLSEIDPFACALLAHRYPETPNVGDMRTIPRRVLAAEIDAPDVLCGGTPCQAFSVAGLRESLSDERGNLSLKFCEIANAIDHVRGRARLPSCVILWENVPGVLSTRDNAFGCFLAGLAGEDGQLVPPGKKWGNAGVVYGPRRAVAWRTLDAQYFGLAQRRQRVFVVASARNGTDPAKVLFEWNGVRRDSAPSRETGASVAGTIAASAGKRRGVSEPDSGSLVAYGGNRTGGPIDVAAALLAQPSGWKGDFESETFLVGPAHTLRGRGFDASEDGTGRGTPLVVGTMPACGGTDKKHGHGWGQQEYENGYAIPAVMCVHGTQDPGTSEHVAFSLGLNQGGENVIAFDTTQITSKENRSKANPGGPCPSLASGAHAPAIAFSCKDHGADAGEISPTLRAMGHGSSHANGGGQIAVAFQNQGTNISVDGDITGTLRTNGDRASGSGPCVHIGMGVRRLTPRECERLQGFPDDYTLIPWRTWQEASRKGSSYEGLLNERGMTLRGPSVEECPDGPRYKALGNSWPVPVVRWIGQRIEALL